MKLSLFHSIQSICEITDGDIEITPMDSYLESVLWAFQRRLNELSVQLDYFRTNTRKCSFFSHTIVDLSQLS